MCAQPLFQKVDELGRRQECFAINSMDNNIKCLMYEGSDTYAEFAIKGHMIKDQIDNLLQNGLTIHGHRFNVRLLLGGDMAFLRSILGMSNCSSTYPCFLCLVHKNDLAFTVETLAAMGKAVPAMRTHQMACMLAHCFGEEYGLLVPYECPGCGKQVDVHLAHPPTDQTTYQRGHFGQYHGCFPAIEIGPGEFLAPC